MRQPRPYIRYRRDLTSRAQILRRDPTPAERKLWYEFLSTHPEKFTRQKPLGSYIADFYCAQKRLVIELDGDTHFTEGGDAYDRQRTAVLGFRSIRVVRFTNAEVLRQFEAVCAQIEQALVETRSTKKNLKPTPRSRERSLPP
jgi:very-short-patch-repair endonuclease